ncbi:Hypothetical_protein [Hexamita inflata]|uniref:Hypothetical_protein n=1 Tax=Hexamita inflata TaxID=28002 RepID=A0AA86U3Y5_9EUKA|nr:Hypothetical protein HINF_LOCUS24722 [Hexamita inflata]
MYKQDSMQTAFKAIYKRFHLKTVQLIQTRFRFTLETQNSQTVNLLVKSKSLLATVCIQFLVDINLQWLDQEQFKYLQVSIFNMNIQSHTELEYLSSINKLSFLQINNSEIQLSLLKLKVSKLCVKRSNLVGNATQDLKVEQFTLSECKFRTSQLMSAEINQLVIENTAEISQFRQNMQTIVDNVQNLTYLSVKNCKFELKTFSRPVIQKCSISGSNCQFIPFKFFQNIIMNGSNLVVQNDPEYLLYFSNEFNKYNNKRIQSQLIYSQFCSHKQNRLNSIIVLSRYLHKQMQFTDLIFSGVE